MSLIDGNPNSTDYPVFATGPSCTEIPTAELAALRKEVEELLEANKWLSAAQANVSVIAERDALESKIADLTMYPPDALTWIFTHCRAIGMECKSDSGKWEHDIALFTSNLKAERDSLAEQLEAARKVITDVRESLQFANDSPNGGINDTIWMMHRPETMFDYIDAALAAQEKK